MNDRSTVDETITHTQRRHLFQKLIGAAPGEDKRLWLALDEVIVSAQDERDELNAREVAELCRHFPGLEHAMLLVWQHISRVDTDPPCRICEPAPAGVAS